jgi:signal transduction histidine kinase
VAFEIAARTILHLGADLISSDAVAIYELIKNAVDAQSKDGVDVDFNIVLLAEDYETFLADAAAADLGDLPALKKKLLDSLVTTASEELLEEFRAKIVPARTMRHLVDAAAEAYRTCNRIIVRDRGHGMTLRDLKEIYLKIGTTNRADAIRNALNEPSLKAPYLGEKGVGRLSAMRLGRHLRVETASEDDTHLNVLEIDWTAFEKAYDKPASSIQLQPVRGRRKPEEFSSGTIITISDLRSSWTLAALSQLIVNQITRMTDPFSLIERRRFRIRVRYNEEPVEHTRSIVKELLVNAHGKCVGKFIVGQKGPKLTVEYSTTLYEGATASEEFDFTDLSSMSGLRKYGESTAALKNLGPFDFELYWFNRQRLRAIEGIGDRNTVRALVNAWAGINLFRDGYRVLPYGDPGDDWLGLDLEALSAGGYKLNTKQLIGRIRIGRLTNPGLLDQTNRQGLVDRAEKRVLVNLMHKVISERWHDYLNEATRTQKQKYIVEFDARQAVAQVDALEERAKTTIRHIRRDFKGDGALLQQVTDAFKELREAHERAVDRIDTMELEKERLTQLAGIGLMIEVIAHELTRTTESTQGTLKGINRDSVDSETAAAFRVLEQQMKIIHRRLRILEPLTIPSRQRRVQRDLVEIVDYVLESHAAQFERHEVTLDGKRPKEPVIAFIIEGHIVQILENLVVNSVYWLDLYKEEHQRFEPKITVKFLDDPPRIRIGDNGPGIPASRAQVVFEPFFSTKPTSANRRSGLGLFVARQNAELLGGTLELVDEGSVHEGRFNTFELELLKEAK